MRAIHEQERTDQVLCRGAIVNACDLQPYTAAFQVSPLNSRRSGIRGGSSHENFRKRHEAARGIRKGLRHDVAPDTKCLDNSADRKQI